MNRRQRLAALAALHEKVSLSHAATTDVPEREAEVSDINLHYVAVNSDAADREFFTEAQRIMGAGPALAASGQPVPGEADPSDLSFADDGDVSPEGSSMYHKEMDHPECTGQVALVDDDTGELEGCYASEADADAALAKLGGTEKPAADVEVTMAAEEFDWEGPLVIEGLASGDGRLIDKGALTWRDLPVPLMLQTVNPEAGGHAGAIVCGSIVEIERVGDEIIGRGRFDSGENGQEAKRLVAEGTMRGVSVDLDMTEVEWRDSSGSAVEMDGLEILFGDAESVMGITAGRIMGATLTPFPAFQEAYLEVNAALVASGAKHPAVWHQPLGLALEALVASAAKQAEVPIAPPTSWFAVPELDGPTPLRVTADGRIFGHVAAWGSCHIGFGDRCVSVPRTRESYRHFRNKQTLTAEGTLVNTGPLYLDGGHAPLSYTAGQAKDWMAETCSAVADVAVYEDEYGIAVAGAVRPTATPEQVRALRGSDVSPDWRSIDGNLEMVGLVAVNTSGFIVPALVASGRWNLESEQPVSLVAAGMVRHDALRADLESLSARLAATEEFILGLRAEKISKRFASACACSTMKVEMAEDPPVEAAPESEASMIPCPECKADIPADSDVCPECGYDLPDSIVVDEPAAV